MSENGFCVWLTGLSGSGKSTIADALALRLRSLDRHVTIFDGDAVRLQMSHDLGFSREDRDANVRRVAIRAADVVNSSGVAICALMSPYAGARHAARNLIGPERFVLVYVATPLSVCESRDVKGLYAKARRGEIRDFVGIDHHYESPRDAELRLDTSVSTVASDVRAILQLLAHRPEIAKREIATAKRQRQRGWQ